MNLGIRSFLPNSALVIAVGAALIVITVSVGAFEYVDDQAERLLSAREATIAEEELKLLEDLYHDEGRDGLIRGMARRAALPSDNLGIIAIADQTGHLLIGNVMWPTGFQADKRWRPVSTQDPAGESVEGYARSVTLQDGTILLVGRNFTANQIFRTSLSEAMIAALATLLTASLGLGFFLNSYVLARIDMIARTTNRVSRNNLAERIPVSSANSEFDHLAIALNSMLDRNEAHLSQMRLMTDAISHDLRLPLQRMRDGLRAASSVEDPALQREAIDHAIGEADAATRIFNVLLGMARAEAGVGKETFDTLDLSSLVQDLAELFGPLAEEKDQALIVDAPTQLIRGQAALLKQAIGNLMQNAIKYTQPGGRISIRLERHQDSFAVLVVEDNGPGIPEAERAQAVQPFGRLARDRDTEGSGLGLSLVAACIKLHDGTLTLGVADPASETHPGLRVTLTLPIVLEPRVLKLKTN